VRNRLLLLATSAALCLVALELGVRVSGFRYSPVEVRGSDWRDHHLFGESYFAFDPLQIWTPVPGRSVFNAAGYRGRLVPAERGPDTRVVVTTGDSNTLGWPGDPIHWPGFLEDELRARGLDAFVANGGVWGHSSWQGRGRLAELLSLRPDVVTISYGANDAHRGRVGDARWVEARGRTRMRLHRSGLGQLILTALDAFRGPPPDPETLVPRVSLEEYGENLRAMVADARAAGARPYLMTRAFLGEARRPYRWKAFAPAYVEATRALGAELGVPVIDLHAAFADREAWFQDESHFTEAGHRRAARIVAEHIAPDL
jgi:lysophospholipase L1-like esterase